MPESMVKVIGQGFPSSAPYFIQEEVIKIKVQNERDRARDRSLLLKYLQSCHLPHFIFLRSEENFPL